MSRERVFLDTMYVLALLNRRDRYHDRARHLFPRFRDAQEIWTTDGVLVEVANAFAALNRQRGSNFIRECLRLPNVRVEPMDRPLFLEGLTMYERHLDKSWGLTDCVSFVVMSRHGLQDALTADVHFVQAGFRALLSED